MTGDQQRAPGYCSDCGRYAPRGRVCGSVDQGSGPGQAVILCDECDQALKDKHAGLRRADRSQTRRV